MECDTLLAFSGLALRRQTVPEATLIAAVLRFPCRRARPISNRCHA
jgi:hypothetical protein